MTAMTTALPTRDEVPVEETWDLTAYYPSVDAWEADLARIDQLVDKVTESRGSLGESAERLFSAIETSFAARQTIERVMVYAFLSRDENIGDPERQSRYERAIGKAIQAGEQMAFFRPEILQIDPDRFTELTSGSQFEPYRHLLDDIVRYRPHTRSVEIEELLAQSADVARTASDAFNALNDVDLTYGSIIDEGGNEIQLSKGRLQLLLENKDRRVRREAFETFMSSYKSHLNTLSSLHSGSVRGDVFYARSHGFESARQSALFDDYVPESVYDNLIQAVQEARPAIDRYLSLRARLLGVDGLALYDLYVPLAPQPERTYEIPEAIDTTKRGVAPLGGGYVDDLSQLIDQRIIDWHETEGKRSGGYSAGSYDAPPVILLNWNGSTDHVFTLAHEVGHAMHSYYANLTQPFHYASYTIFTAEIASTVNEVFLTWQLLNETPESEPAERFAILNRFADAMWGTIIRQTMFADFEQRTHQAVEQGQPLTAATLNQLYGEMSDIYYPGVLNDDLVKLQWSRIPHFYRAFYVYQYATGMSAAIAIARAIRDGGDEPRERYLEMLKAGGSDYPLPLLQRAGVDLTTPEPVRAALQVFDETVQEMAQIVDDGGFEQA
jgi:oligoendopeptidase F